MRDIGVRIELDPSGISPPLSTTKWTGGGGGEAGWDDLEAMGVQAGCRLESAVHKYV